MASFNPKEGNIEEYSFIYGDEAVTYEVIRKVFAEGKKRKSPFECIQIAESL